jgi:Fe2+ transport system protein FeoA
MQLDVNRPVGHTLLDLQAGERGLLEAIDLPADHAVRLMEMGFLPGTIVTPGCTAPGGCPRVFRVAGSEVAIRCETAACVRIIRQV